MCAGTLTSTGSRHHRGCVAVCGCRQETVLSTDYNNSMVFNAHVSSFDPLTPTVLFSIHRCYRTSEYNNYMTNWELTASPTWCDEGAGRRRKWTLHESWEEAIYTPIAVFTVMIHWLPATQHQVSRNQENVCRFPFTGRQTRYRNDNIMAAKCNFSTFSNQWTFSSSLSSFFTPGCLTAQVVT